jgi:hypothetical protein
VLLPADELSHRVLESECRRVWKDAPRVSVHPASRFWNRAHVMPIEARDPKGDVVAAH